MYKKKKPPTQVSWAADGWKRRVSAPLPVFRQATEMAEPKMGACRARGNSAEDNGLGADEKGVSFALPLFLFNLFRAIIVGCTIRNSHCSLPVETTTSLSRNADTLPQNPTSRQELHSPGGRLLYFERAEHV